MKVCIRFRFILGILWVAVIFLRCGKDESNDLFDPNKRTVNDFLPLQIGNEWTYQVEEWDEDGQILSTHNQRWVVEKGRRISYASVPDSFSYGYRIIYRDNEDWIYNSVGKYLSDKYIEYPLDSLVLVERRITHLDSRQFIQGGLEKLSSHFGELDCIKTKSILEFGRRTLIYYRYHCYGIGIVRIEEFSNFSRQEGKKDFYLERKFELTSYDIQ